MSFGEDWFGWTLSVFIIVTIIFIVIKVFIEYPGLTELKCVYKESIKADLDIIVNGENDIKRKKKSRISDKGKTEEIYVSTEILEISKEITEMAGDLEDQHEIKMEEKTSVEVICEKNPENQAHENITVAIIENSKPLQIISPRQC